MKPLAPALAAAGALAFAAQAEAGETACVFERGVLIVPAQVMGVSGDFILDTGQARTQLSESQAEGAGLAGPELVGELRFAGLSRAAQPIAVADLDARTVFLPTPIAGVIGMDALRGLVLDVRFAPCRVWVGSPAAAPAFRADREAPLGWASGLPVMQASVNDGARGWPGEFVPATGLDLSLRLDDRLAAAPDATQPKELYPGGVGRARLAGVEFAGDMFANIDVGLIKGAPDAPWPAGWIGGPVLSHYRLRFDFVADRLQIARKR